jgi:hypothetical protein
MNLGRGKDPGSGKKSSRIRILEVKLHRIPYPQHWVIV